MGKTPDQHAVIGFRARFNIADHLLKLADDLGLKIARVSQNTYSVHSPSQPLDLDALCPDFIAQKDGLFDVHNLERFLKFMHQPLHESMIHARAQTTAHEHDAMPNIAQMRRNIHQAMRLITVGDSAIPDEGAYVAHDGGAECHGKVEEEMAIADLWRNEREIGNTQQPPSALPNSVISLTDGFGFALRPDVMEGTALGLWMRNAIDDISDARADEEHIIFLRGDDISQLCMRAYDDPMFSTLLEAHSLDTRITQHIEHVNARAHSLEHYFDMQTQSALHEDKDLSKQLKDLQVYSSSALTPILCSGAMNDIWAYYHVTDRKESPIEGLEQDFECLERVIEHFTKDNRPVDAVTAQAITNEFYPLLTFSKKAAQILEINNAHIIENTSITGIDGTMHALSGDHHAMLDMIEKSMGQGDSALKSFAVEGGKSIINVFGESIAFGARNWKVFAPLTAGYVYVLANPDAQQWMMESYTHFNPPPAPQALPDDFDVFSQDVSLVADPNNTDPVCHLHITAVHCAFNDFMKDMTTDTIGFIETSVDMMGEKVGLSDITAGDRPGYYSPAIESSFAKGARDAVQPVASTFLNVNLLQWAAHLSFYGALMTRGFKNGVSGGFASTKGFFGEVTNTGNVLIREKWPAITAALATAPALAMNTDMNNAGIVYSTIAAFAAGYHMWNRKPQCHRQLMDLIDEKNPQPQYKLPEHENSVYSDIASAALARENFANSIKESPYALSLSGTLKRKFTISAQNIAPLSQSLEKFDVLLSHLTEEIGAGHAQAHSHSHSHGDCSHGHTHCAHAYKEHEDAPYQRFLQSKVRVLRDALSSYAKDGDAQGLGDALEAHMVDLMGTQIRQTGSASLYHNLFNHVSTHKQKADLAHLTRHGNALFGEHMRAQSMLKSGQVIDMYKDRFPLAPERIKAEISLRTMSLWDDVVALSRGIQKTWHKSPDLKLHLKDQDISARNITIATAASVVALMDMTEMSDALLDGNSLEAFDAVSGTIGATMSTALFGATFAGYNLWDDIVWNDMIIGFGACLTSGVVANLAYKRGIVPAWETAREYLKAHQAQKPQDSAQTQLPEKKQANIIILNPVKPAAQSASPIRPLAHSCAACDDHTHHHH